MEKGERFKADGVPTSYIRLSRECREKPGPEGNYEHLENDVTATPDS
jgi:hypothetical protein